MGESPVGRPEHEEEQRVGDPGEEGEDRPPDRVAAVGVVAAQAADEGDADQDHRHDDEGGPARALPRMTQASSPTQSTWKLATTVARPAPMYPIEMCHRVRSTAEQHDRRRAPAGARGGCAVADDEAEHHQDREGVGDPEEGGGGGGDVGEADEDRRERDGEDAGEAEEAGHGPSR